MPSSTRDIALALGVPPLLLGLPGDNTLANYQEANRAFWRQTVIPLVARLQKSFEAWLQPACGCFRFDYDVDRLDALAQERAQEWTRIDSATFLTRNEKREAAGYAPEGAKDDAAALDTGAGEATASGDAGGGAWQNQPRDDQGRWVSEGGANFSRAVFYQGANCEDLYNTDYITCQSAVFENDPNLQGVCIRNMFLRQKQCLAGFPLTPLLPY